MALDLQLAGNELPTRSDRREKMPKLAEGARIHKRPLHRPAIPSAYSSEPKVVYISTKTPFMGAVKRVDKLLGLAEKRAVQSVTATVRNENPRKRRKVDEDKSDEISSIAQTLNERQIKEQVVVKGTGKAINKTLEIGLWFQKRQQYAVTLRTGTVESVDDIEIDDEAPTEPQDEQKDESHNDAGAQALGERTETSQVIKSTKTSFFQDSGQRDETRIRAVSVIEVHISLR